VIPDAAAGPPVAVADSAVPQSIPPHDEASPEFAKELELTIHPSKMFLCSKFARKCLKAKLLLFRRLHLTRASVRLTVENY
jgi:hypothetical protein